MHWSYKPRSIHPRNLRLREIQSRNRELAVQSSVHCTMSPPFKKLYCLFIHVAGKRTGDKFL